MSFSTDVKKELTQLPATTGTLLGLIRMSGSLGLTADGLTLSVSTENAAIAHYIYQMLDELFDRQAEIRVRQKENLAKNHVYSVFLADNVDDLLDELSLTDGLMGTAELPEIVRLDRHMARDYLRGVFLSAGSVANPQAGNYQLELTTVYQSQALELQGLLTDFDLTARLSEHKERFILYLTRADEIANFLTLIGAMQARLRFEDAKIIREMRGLANRQANFESANISKSITAAQDVIAAIHQLTVDKKLPAELTDIAKLRLSFPEASLTELGQMMTPPLGKSGVAHRLRKIKSLREELSAD